MRKRMIVLTAGLTAALLMGGCSAETATKETTAATTEAETSAEETESAETSEGTEASETDSEKAAEDEEEGILDLTAPMRIWGDIVTVEGQKIVVDNQSEVGYVGEIIFNISPDGGRVLDAESGLPVELDQIEAGRFEAYVGPAMTMSLPPQTNPDVVLVNIKEDTQVPRYAVSTGTLIEEDGIKILEASDGAEYSLSEDVEVEPYLTKNIVTLDDIKEGTCCMVWTDEEEWAYRVMIFPEKTEAEEEMSENGGEAAVKPLPQ